MTIYLIKNSNHIFDNEAGIAKLLDGYELRDGSKTIKPYSFENSQDNQLAQVFDAFAGLIRELLKFINTNLFRKS